MEQSAQDGAGGGLSVLKKANAVLGALQAGGELTVAQIAERSGESVGTLYRLLAALVPLEWVDRGSRRGRYRVGMQFVRLASALDRQMDLRRIVAPALQELHRRTGETSFLVVRSGTNGVCIDRIEGLEVFSLAMRLGESLPLNSGAAPLALLAFEEERERDRLILDLALHDDERRTLQQRIAAAHRGGVVWSDEDVTPGIAACGAAILDHRGGVAASLSVSGRRQTLLGAAARIEDEVRHCAEQASLAMGWPGERPSEPTS